MGVLITASTEQPGGWHIVYFDEDGFAGHIIRSSKAAALHQAVADGFRDTDRKMLMRLRRSDRFHHLVGEE